MSRRIHIAVVMVLALFALAALVATQKAVAQPSCPGGILQIQNKTPCPLTVNLNATPALPPIAVGPGATVMVGVAPGTVIHAVKSIGGILYAFPPTPPEPACTPVITMAPGCCARVCLFPHNCIIQITPGPSPCAP
ncbi:MAG: hypothetical protein JST22_00685 [Bacteroidetes bacterium]|nr:hypothetical protein [Bacteroidota bacterium]